MTRPFAAALSIALVLVCGCAGERDSRGPREQPVGPGAALDRGYDEYVRIGGFLVIRKEHRALLCEAQLLSYPPHCGGAAVPVRGSSLPTTESFGGVRWADHVVLEGTFENGVLTLDE